MQLSINWLKDYLQNQDLGMSPKDLAEKITLRGLAVESVSGSSRGLDNVVIGKIEKIEKHPNADKLQVTHVRISDKDDELLQIVCGAKNIAEGDVVPVAMIGAVLPGDFKIKKSKIRGVESSGMICSGKELEISDDGDGILQLPKHSTLGDPLTKMLGSDDTILDFEITANRGDCLSVLGLAREIAPVIKNRVKSPKAPRFRISNHKTSSIIKVEVDDELVCPRYVARVIDNLKVGESADWIQQRLKSVGIRPVNNIVDITNFVMLEYGQPLHAFDLKKLSSGTVKVSRCDKTADFELLNGEHVQIEPGDILILDGDRPIALAGIMGGANTQINDDTTSIFLESATFDASQIRKTAKRLGLHTDSSKRFERKVDFVGVGSASERAAALLRDSYDGNVYHPPIDTNSDVPKPQAIAVDMRDVRKVTGLYNLSAEKTADLLETIGIETHKRSTNVFIAKVPSFRSDLEKSIDLVEEAARLIGYDVIPERFPLPAPPEDKFDEEVFSFEMQARRVLAGLGLRETVQYSFTSENVLIKYGSHEDGLVKLNNPISEEFKVMRPSLLPSLLETYLYNRNRRSEGQRLFEVARTYKHNEKFDTTVEETTRVGGLVSGLETPRDWKKNEQEIDFFYVKGLLDVFMRKLTTVKVNYEPIKNHKLFFPQRSAELKLGHTVLGQIGEVHPYVRNQVLETKEAIVLFEINLDALRKYRRTTCRYKKPSKFPSVDFDLAITVDKSVSTRQLEETALSAGGDLLSGFQLFDIYKGENIPMGKQSLAFHLSFVSGDKTLEEAEAEALKEKILKALQEKHGVQLR